MLDRKTLVIGAASLAIGVAISGVFLGNEPEDETASAIQAERDFMDFTMPDVSQADEPRANAETVIEQNAEPPVSKAERDFMDFTMPDLSKPTEDENPTLDGCIKPPRPQWVIDRTPQEAVNAKLLRSIYDRNRHQSIIDTKSCPCEIEYPSWDDSDAQYREIAEGKDRGEIQEIGGDIAREAAQIQRQSRDICREWQGR
jgi:hypothetical protein